MIQKVVLIGAGNVATHLALAFYKAGIKIECIYSRKLENAQWLAQKVNAYPINKLSDIPAGADLYLLSVKDNALAEIASNLHLPDKYIAHTAGSMPMDTLKQATANYGVFYPLQTFSKTKDLDFTEVPLCIEAINQQTETLLTGLAQQISNKVYRIEGQQRQILHVAAVFVSNYTNFMFTIAEDITAHHHIDPEILRPLMRETVDKLQYMKAHQAQTGPAVRGDENTILHHLELLRQFPEFKEIYKLLSKAIMKRH